MINFTTRHRRIARDVARAGTALSSAMLMLSVIGAVGSDSPAAAVAQNAGSLQILVPPGTAAAGQPLTSGASATTFALTPPVGASCTGDTATGGYRMQTYMVPASVDPSTLTYGGTGPIPAGTGVAFRQPLFSSGNPFVNGTTGVATQAGGGGLLTGLPAFSFGLFGASGPQIVPTGIYNLGVACTVGSASATQLDKYWNVQLTFAASPSDVPSGITWTATGGSTTTTTTTVAQATTTTTPGATTTTAAAATTTTIRSGVTTTTLAGSGASTTTTLLGSGSATTTTVNALNLPRTGSASVALWMWAVLLVVFGRMALLLGRPIRVLESGA